MTTRLIENDNQYYCANCRMKQHQLQPSCFFCGKIFYNYENIIIKNYKNLVDAKMIEAIKEIEDNDKDWKPDC